MATNAQEQPDSPPPSEDILPRGNKPFSREELAEALARAKPYDPDSDVTASEPFDVEEFIRVIHEARDRGMIGR